MREDFIVLKIHVVGNHLYLSNTEGRYYKVKKPVKECIGIGGQFEKNDLEALELKQIQSFDLYTIFSYEDNMQAYEASTGQTYDFKFDRKAFERSYLDNHGIVYIADTEEFCIFKQSEIEGQPSLLTAASLKKRYREDDDGAL